MASVTVGETFAREEFQGVVDSMHGGLRQVTIAPIPASMGALERAEYEQNPIYRYIFNDGTYIDARADPETDSDIQIVKYQPSKQAQTTEREQSDEQVSAPSNQPNIVRRVNGELVSEPNPNYRPPASDQNVSAPTNQPYIVRRDENGQLQYEENPNYIPPEDESSKPMTEYQRETLGLQREASERADAAARRAELSANRPTIVNANQKDPYITTMDVEGNLTSQPNPSYDAALSQYERQKERLSTAIQLGQLDAQQAKMELDRWFTINVDLPFKQSAEARARAAEIRQAQEAEDRRRQFSANYELQRSQAGLNAGQDAVRQELALLPYRAGPKFGEQMSSAINSLAKGTTQGINFTSEAFDFKGPNLQKIAQKATARALSSISPAAQALASGGGGPSYATADYSGINLTPGTPPPSGGGIDINAILQGLPYGGDGGAAPAEYSYGDFGGEEYVPTPEELAAMA